MAIRPAKQPPLPDSVGALSRVWRGVTECDDRHAGGDQERPGPACGADIFAKIESRQERGQRIRGRGERQREAKVGTLQGQHVQADVDDQQ